MTNLQVLNRKVLAIVQRGLLSEEDHATYTQLLEVRECLSHLLRTADIRTKDNSVAQALAVLATLDL